MELARPRGWRRVAGIAFAVAAFLFLGLFVARNLEALRAHDWSVRPLLLLASLVLNVIGLAWGVKVWQLLLRRLDARIPFPALARVWFVSGLGRYIPGKIWQFVGAAQLGGRVGLGPAVVVTSLAVHTGFFILGAVLVAVYLAPAPAGAVGGVAVEVLRWGAPLLLLAAHPRVIGGAIRLVRKATSGSVEAWRGGWGYGVGLVLLSGIGWAISGVAFHLFVLSLTPVPAGAMPGIVGVNALAFVAGYVVFIAPAGLGAKETALTGLLAFYLPAPVAALVAIAARLWMVASEVIPALLLLRAVPDPAPAPTPADPASSP